MTTSNPTRLHFFLVVAIAGAIWFSLLGYRDLFDPDEGRYAQIPSAMVSSGDWLTPRLNGVKYFEKPVFQYWAVATVFTVAGKSNATARFVPALLGFLGALFAALVAKQIFGRGAGYYAFLFTGSGLMWLGMAHILNLDMALSAFVLFGIGSLAMAQHDRSDPRRVRRWMLAGWAALAIAVLTKGLIGVVLPAAAVVVYSAWQRDFSLWKHLHLGTGLLLFLAIASPWFFAVSVANPEFAQFFFIHEHWDRYTSGVHNREGPLWYFVPYLLIGLLPWLAVSLKALLSPDCGWLPRNPGTFDARRLLWSFAVVTFVFFSLGGSKLPPYILPIMPVIAILAAGRMAGRAALGADRWVLALVAIGLFVLAYESYRFVSPRYPMEMVMDIRRAVIAGGVLFSLAAITAFLFNRKPLLACGAASILSIMALQFVLWGLQPLAEVRSGRDLADAIKLSVPAGAPVYSIQTFSESVPFYLDRTITVVQYTGELEFGLQQEPDQAIHDWDRFLTAWDAADSAAAIVDVPRLQEFFPGVDPAKIVYLGPKRAVVVK
jgi:4-amino-4-deoxy-L-arabinose transferase-like glycosyltransferase